MAATLALTGGSFYEEASAYYVQTTFPRVAAIAIGSPQNYGDVSVQAQLAKLHYIVVDFYPNWGGSVTKIRDAVKAIKARANQKIVIVDYVIQETIHNTSAGMQPFRNKLDAEHWWLYQNGSAGTKTVDGSVSTTNFTNYVPKDANGDRWNTWFAKYVYDSQWKYLVPELDGTFTDNFYWKPRVNGDWNRDSTRDSQTNTLFYSAFRTGMRAHANQIRALMPGTLVTGNIGDWGRPEATVPEYAGQLDGGLLERYIGETWSNEGVDQNGVFNGWGSWSRMMGAYHKVMGLVKEPKLVIFGMKGKPTAYQAFRYGFASALMNNAYFAFSDGTGGSLYAPKVPWFEEYDLAGSNTTSWLGNAFDPPQTKAGPDGVYRRRFQNGMALANPRNNGPRTVTAPGYCRFKGKTQAPMVNNGNPATSFTLLDRDGILLKKC